MAKEIELYVKIAAKSDDAAVSQFANKLKDIAKTSDEAKEKANGLKEAFRNLAGFIGGMFVVNKLTGWLKEGIMAYIEEERALRSVTAMIKQYTPAVVGLTEKIREHSEAMKQVGLDEGVFYQSIREIIPLTKDYENSVKVVTLAWDIANATGKDYQEVLIILRDLVANSPRSLKVAYKELGAEGQTAQEKLDNLYARFSGYTAKLQDHLTEVQRLKNAWQDFWKKMAEWIVNALDYWKQWHQAISNAVLDIGIKISSVFSSSLQAQLMGLKENMKEIYNANKGGIQNAGSPAVVGGGRESGQGDVLQEMNEHAITLKSSIDEVIKEIDKIVTLNRSSKKIEWFKIDIPLNEELAKWNDFFDKLTTMSEQSFKHLSLSELATTRKSLELMKKDYLKYERDVTKIEREIAKVKAQEALKSAQTAIESLRGVVSAHTAVGKALVALDAVVAFANAYAAAVAAMKDTPGDAWVRIAAYATTLAAGLAGVLEIQQAFSKTKSAAGGYDIPAGVNPLVQAHAKEMILPANIADTIRALTDAGFGQINNSYGGNTNIVVNALTGGYALRETAKRLKTGNTLYKNLKVGGK